LEKWMLEQMGPQKFWEQLKTEAPRFAKLIPELPRLVHAYLQRDHSADRTELMRLLEAQRQTHQTLQAILLLALGFMAGIVITAMLGVWSLSN
jgi:ubiquinone biosynthesis protein